MSNLNFKNSIDYIKGLPEKRIAAAVLVFNEKGEVLIIKNSYRDFWTIPGGVVEKHEAPWEGAAREAREEVGLDVKIDKLLVMDNSSSWKGDNKDYHDEVLIMIFSTKALSSEQLAKLKIDDEEVIDHKFVKVEDLSKYLNDRWVKRIGGIDISGDLKMIKSDYS